MKIKIRSGQILAEVVVAIGVTAVVLVGISQLMSRSTVSIRQNKQKDEAIRVVDSKIQYYRRERDRNEDVFFKNIVHDLDSGGFRTCLTPWPITTQYTFDCTERFSSVTEGVLVEVRASWTDKTANDRNLTLSAIISRL